MGQDGDPRRRETVGARQHSRVTSGEDQPQLGIRARFVVARRRRWEQSGGDFSKFGLSAAEMVEAVDKLKAWGEADTVKRCHFHLGSQISAIKSVKNALREAGRLFVELYKLGARACLRRCRRGLGVDYDGSQTNFDRR